MAKVPQVALTQMAQDVEDFSASAGLSTLKANAAARFDNSGVSAEEEEVSEPRNRPLRRGRIDIMPYPEQTKILFVPPNKIVVIKAKPKEVKHRRIGFTSSGKLEKEEDPPQKRMRIGFGPSEEVTDAVPAHKMRIGFGRFEEATEALPTHKTRIGFTASESAEEADAAPLKKRHTIGFVSSEEDPQATPKHRKSPIGFR
jgi:hypothetical protein